MEKRHFGIVEASIDDQAKRVVMTCKRQGPEATRLMPGNMAKVAAWALDGVRDLKAAGYQIDTTSISGYLAGG